VEDDGGTLHADQVHLELSPTPIALKDSMAMLREAIRRQAFSATPFLGATFQNHAAT